MTHKEFVLSKIGGFLCKSRLFRRFVMAHYKWVMSRKYIALVPEGLVEKYGEKFIRNEVKKHKGVDFFIDGTPVKFVNNPFNEASI